MLWSESGAVFWQKSLFSSLFLLRRRAVIVLRPSPDEARHVMEGRVCFNQRLLMFIIISSRRKKKTFIETSRIMLEQISSQTDT